MPIGNASKVGTVVPPTRCAREFYFLDDVINPLASKLSPILLCMCKVMSNNEAMLSPGPYIADHSIAN